MKAGLAGRWPILVLALVLLAFFVLPIGYFLALVAATCLGPGRFASTPTRANLARLTADVYTLGVFATTLRIGVVVTLLCVLLGYPLAHFLARETGKARRAAVPIVTASLSTNLIVRTYGWIILLTPKGLLNSALVEAGLIARRSG